MPTPEQINGTFARYVDAWQRRDRDALLACSMLEEEAIAWLQAEGQRRAAEGPHSLAPDLLVVTRESVTAYGPESELAAALAGAGPDADSR